MKPIFSSAFLTVFLASTPASADALNNAANFHPAPPPPNKGSFGADVEDVKVFTVPSWTVVKGDGETAIIFSKMQVTLLHLKRNGQYSTAVRANFDQYNNTENNQGTHHATMRVSLTGAAGSNLAVPYSVNITRDACNNLGTINLSQVELDTDIFNFVTDINADIHLDWNREGAC